MISQELKNRLALDDDFKDFLNKIDLKERIKVDEYKKLAKKVAKSAYQKAVSHSEYKLYIRFPEKISGNEILTDDDYSMIISGPTLKTLLDDNFKKSNDHGNRSKSLNAWIFRSH